MLTLVECTTQNTQNNIRCVFLSENQSLVEIVMMKEISKFLIESIGCEDTDPICSSLLNTSFLEKLILECDTDTDEEDVSSGILRFCSENDEAYKFAKDYHLVVIKKPMQMWVDIISLEQIYTGSSSWLWTWFSSVDEPKFILDIKDVIVSYTIQITQTVYDIPPSPSPSNTINTAVEPIIDCDEPKREETGNRWHSIMPELEEKLAKRRANLSESPTKTESIEYYIQSVIQPIMSELEEKLAERRKYLSDSHIAVD
jgi:hypothetical protein